MALNDVLAELSQLSKRDKLRAMQFLATELAAEEEEVIIPPGVEQRVYTPLGNEEAAKILWEMLQRDAQNNQPSE